MDILASKSGRMDEEVKFGNCRFAADQELSGWHEE